MAETESPETGTPSRRPHPLPVFCWLWAVGGLFLLMIGGLMLQFCLNPPAAALAEVPRSNPRWNELTTIASAGIAIGLGYGWFWHRFAVKRILTRNLWHVGAGLILSGAFWLFMVGWLLTAVVFLLTLAVWAQGLTRKHFNPA